MSMIGKSLAHYEITGQIGKGGMGEVYQAKDTKLGRDVAIKVLIEDFALDADRITRFQREAKLLASLNHPNIAAIYGLEKSDDTHFLVMELIEGQTLADRIKTSAIPVEESLKLALQIAEALETAHEKGVIHRDLKPANIKVTPDGKVKVLDFGLAKAYAGDQENLSPMDSPTISAAATQKGVILGTAAYMSPEQAKGKSVDKRADIWAFGVILFEMLTGRQLFTGETVSDTLASVLAREPAWQNLPSDLHSRIRFLLERCLEKEAKDRYSGINDARVEIQKVLADPSGVFFQPVAKTKPKKKLQLGLPLVATIAVVCIIIAALAVWKLKPTEPRQVMRFDYDLPEGQQFTSYFDMPVLAVSPDGKQFVYATPEGLYLRSVDELTAKHIAGTKGATLEPFFSHDGKWIAYVSMADRKLKKISINGGAPVVICDLMSFIGGSWNEDDTIVFGRQTGSIMRVSSDGGIPEDITEVASGRHIFPQILPGGEYLMYTAEPNPRVLVQSLKSGEIKELFAGFAARYLPTGHIVYMLPDNNNLFAVPFDPDRLEITGGAVPIVEGIWQYAVSETGTLVCVPGTTSASSGGMTLVWVDRNGKEEPLGVNPNTYLFPKIAPDGSRVASAIFDENIDIWVWDLDRKTMTRLTFDKGADITPIWTPDSRQVLFWSAREGTFGGIFRKQADGTGEVEKLVADQDRQLLPWDLPSDGKTLVVIDTPDPNSQGDISILSMEGDHGRKSLVKTDEYLEIQPKISPDGKWMAYCSNESDRMEIYVRSFPEVDKGRWQVSTNGGVSPLWAPDGRELFYLSIDDDPSVMTVSVETGTAFSAGTPKRLFSRSSYFGGIGAAGTPWDIHPDGGRFLMTKLGPAEGDESASVGLRKINIFLNWDEELKQRVPVD